MARSVQNVDNDELVQAAGGRRADPSDPSSVAGPAAHIRIRPVGPDGDVR